MANTSRLSREEVRGFVLLGAEARVRQIQAEIESIEQHFPELRVWRAHRTAVKRRTRRVSDAARVAASKRMKRYWAERRKVRRARE